MTILESLLDYFETFPGMDRLRAIDAEAPGEAPGSCALAPTGETTIREYMDGSALLRYDFVFCLRQITAGNAERIANSGLLAELSAWLAEGTRTGRLPKLPQGMECESISSQNGMLYELDQNGNAGDYRIQCQMTYERMN